MKYILYRKRREENDNPNPPIEVGRFDCQGDALWAGTIFASHKGWSHFVHWVQKGGRIFHVCSALNMDDFNFIQKGEGKA